MTLPNFFIVGAPKAGTDGLYYHLDQHPQIYMSPLKEPSFFSSEIRLDNFVEELQSGARISAESLRHYLDSGVTTKRFGGMVTCMHDYQRLFLSVGNESAIGEGSVSYLWSPSAPSAIASAIPDARIIIVLMDPAKRAFHQYLKSLSDRNVTHSFRVHLEKAFQDKQDRINIYHPFLAFGNYAEQIRRYKEQFSPRQIHLSLYEDLRSDYQGWFRSILNFLGVDDGFTPRPVDIPSTPLFSRLSLLERNGIAAKLRPVVTKLLPRSFKSKIRGSLYQGGAKPSLSSEDRRVLVNYYRNNILELEEIIGRDLSAWRSI